MRKNNSLSVQSNILNLNFPKSQIEKEDSKIDFDELNSEINRKIGLMSGIQEPNNSFGLFSFQSSSNSIKSNCSNKTISSSMEKDTNEIKSDDEDESNAIKKSNTLIESAFADISPIFFNQNYKFKKDKLEKTQSLFSKMNNTNIDSNVKNGKKKNIQKYCQNVQVNKVKKELQNLQQKKEHVVNVVNPSFTPKNTSQAQQISSHILTGSSSAVMNNSTNSNSFNQNNLSCGCGYNANYNGIDSQNNVWSLANSFSYNNCNSISNIMNNNNISTNTNNKVYNNNNILINNSNNFNSNNLNINNSLLNYSNNVNNQTTNNVIKYIMNNLSINNTSSQSMNLDNRITSPMTSIPQVSPVPQLQKNNLFPQVSPVPLNTPYQNLTSNSLNSSDVLQNYQNFPNSNFILSGNNNSINVNTNLNSFKQTSQEQSNPKFIIHFENILSGLDKRTTLMIRHIPNKYSLKLFTHEINEYFKNKYDVLYLPIDYCNNCNLGFAFINFLNPLHIIDFYERFQGKRWKKFLSVKTCDLYYAKIQGRKNLEVHFEKGSVLNSQTSEKRPLVLNIPKPYPKISLRMQYLNLYKKYHPEKMIFPGSGKYQNYFLVDDDDSL